LPNIFQMKILETQFITSSTQLSKCPSPDFPEYAFIGRSNVGKSSLINMLTSQKSLAKTSSRPGKTQLINHFLINKEWYLTDLPGFGFAKVSKEKKATWDAMIHNYLLKRENLMCVFMLIDSRLELQKVDRELMLFLGKNGVPFVNVYTKIDKLSKTGLDKNIALLKRQIKADWETLPDSFLTSAEKQLGREEILAFIDRTNLLFKK
jgi:GTP-binding protein